MLDVIERWMRDVRVGARTVVREPAFGLAAIGTFALGIGAATAIFSVAYGVAFRPLPYPDADRLVRIYESNTRTSEPKLNVSEATFQAWRDGVTSLESAALHTAIGIRYTPAVPAQPVSTMSVTPRLFEVLGASPLHGAVLAEDPATGIPRSAPPSGPRVLTRSRRCGPNEQVGLNPGHGHDGVLKYFGSDPATIGGQAAIPSVYVAGKTEAVPSPAFRTLQQIIAATCLIGSAGVSH